ncbi:ABC transporter substrate-binding protein [Thermoclostridium stercorarium]|uniref:ABC transporter substrate-binding protein n=1 Tax=Thermoclostridium stercorarium TaxID=1510 RepID=UPI0022496A19|nr:ABC transporter substrate-binding protein [Thermoclostridium stercorarium]UZQ85702.1 ABC transporter substrate-binding protein [Thermoclostridium stercorarium]
MRLKRIFAALMSFAMLLSMTACNVTQTDKQKDTGVPTTTQAGSQTAGASEKELYRIDVFTMLGNKAGEQTGWFAKIVKDKFNIEMNMIASNVEGGDTKFATMMASGDLGDIVIFGSDSDNKWLDALKANALFDWTTDGILDTYGKYIVENYSKAIEKNKISFGNGKSVYGLGHSVANMPEGPSEGEDMVYQSELRWDLYEKIGMPEIESPEDLLHVLKRMQEIEPTSESGMPTYGFSIWSDWDGNMVMYVKSFAALFGCDEGDGFNNAGFLLYSPDDGDCQGALDPDGWYIRVLRLFFKANQMGLLDPDSISQKYDDVIRKYQDGAILFSLFPWACNVYNTPERLSQGKGFRYVPIKGQKIISYGFDERGGNRVISIGAKAEHPERLMELINWMYTPEGVMTIYNGPEGLTWEMKNGKPVLTEFGKQALPNNPVDVPEEFGGGTFQDGQNQMNFETVHRNAINPETNEPYDFRLWSSYLEENSNPLLDKWREAMGALTTKDYLMKNNMVSIKKPVYMGKAPDVMPDDLMQKQGQVATVIKQYSWRMMYAKDEAEFEQLLSEMTAKAKGLGYDEVLKWNIEHAKEVYEFLKKNN